MQLAAQLGSSELWARVWGRKESCKKLNFFSLFFWKSAYFLGKTDFFPKISPKNRRYRRRYFLHKNWTFFEKMSVFRLFCSIFTENMAHNELVWGFEKCAKNCTFFRKNEAKTLFFLYFERFLSKNELQNGRYRSSNLLSQLCARNSRAKQRPSAHHVLKWSFLNTYELTYRQKLRHNGPTGL